MNGLQAKRNDAINYVHLVITSSAEFLCMPLLIVGFSEEHFTVIERAPRKEPESQSFNRRGLREALFQNTSAGELFALISSS
jgi:hypothetical protein